jgi:hypothetical protein
MTRRPRNFRFFVESGEEGQTESFQGAAVVIVMAISAAVLGYLRW